MSPRNRIRRGPTDEEIARYKILPEWDEAAARSLEAGARLLWIHTKRGHYSSLDPSDAKLVKQVTLTGKTDELLLTDFGKYRLQNGKNQFEACGCKRFCDCYGQLYLFCREI